MTIDLEDFANLAVEAFDRILADYGFRRISKKLEGHFFTADYVSGSRYISLRANTHPRDFPPYFNVVLGEGSMDWPECDWNSVALWRLRNFLEPAADAAEYDLENAPDANRLIAEASADIVSFHGGFLEGDVKGFRTARAAQNRMREPYKIHQPDGRGGYRTRVDTESARLKDEFSQE